MLTIVRLFPSAIALAVAWAIVHLAGAIAGALLGGGR